jgi:hypothetical protein
MNVFDGVVQFASGPAIIGAMDVSINPRCRHE